MVLQMSHSIWLKVTWKIAGIEQKLTQAFVVRLKF